MKRFIARHVSGLPKSGIRDFFEIVSKMKDVISLGIGEPDFDTPWHIREAAIYALEKGKTHYTSNLGLIELRRAIATYVENHYGLGYRPDDEIIVTVGVSEAIDLALRALINPGDKVLYHQPCYVSYHPGVALAHGVPIPVPTRADDGFALNVQDIAKAWQPGCKVLMINLPCNPTGGTCDRARLEKIAQFAVEKDLIVLSDEIYSELVYDGAHTSIAVFPGMRERTIFLHGFSKAFAMTGFRATVPLAELFWSATERALADRATGGRRREAVCQGRAHRRQLRGRSAARKPTAEGDVVAVGVEVGRLCRRRWGRTVRRTRLACCRWPTGDPLR